MNLGPREKGKDQSDQNLAYYIMHPKLRKKSQRVYLQRVRDANPAVGNQESKVKCKEEEKTLKEGAGYREFGLRRLAIKY